MMSTAVQRFCVAALVLGVVLAVPSSEPKARTAGHAGPGGDFGLGLVLGTPTGLSAEYFIDRANSLHLTLGLDALEGQRLYLSLNWRGYLASLVDGRRVRLPIYVGLGGYVADQELNSFGVRAPLGFSIDFRRNPLNLFFELGAALELTGDESLSARIGGAFGFHFYF